MRRKFLEKDGSVTLNDLLITARAQEAVDLQIVAMRGNANSEQVNNVTDTGLNRNADRGVVLTVTGMIILQGIEDVLQGVVNVTSVEKSVILKLSVGEGHPEIFSSGKDEVSAKGDSDRSESLEQDERPSTGPEYVFFCRR